MQIGVIEGDATQQWHWVDWGRLPPYTLLIPLGFCLFFFPSPSVMTFPNPPPTPQKKKQPYATVSVRGPHYRPCCQSERSRVRAKDQHDQYDPCGLINQLVFFPHPPMRQRSFWKTERRGRDEREGEKQERKSLNKSASLIRVSFFSWHCQGPGLYDEFAVMTLGPSVHCDRFNCKDLRLTTRTNT